MRHPDQRLLQAPHVVDDVEGLREPDDRVADELAGAVPGDATAPVDVDDGGAVHGPVLGPGAAAGRVHRAVLQQHQHVRAAVAAGGGVGALGVPGGEVVDEARPIHLRGIRTAAAGPVLAHGHTLPPAVRYGNP